MATPSAAVEIVNASEPIIGSLEQSRAVGTRRERAQDELQQADGHRDPGSSGCVATAQPGQPDRRRCTVTRQIDHLNGDRPARLVGKDKPARSYSRQRLPGDLEAECSLSVGRRSCQCGGRSICEYPCPEHDVNIR